MTAATTSSNKGRSFFSVRFRNKMSEDLKLLIINLCLQLLCTPVFIGIILKFSYDQERFMENNIAYYNPQASVPFIIVAVISLFISISLGLIIPMINFRYLYNKSLVDMNYSLPLNNCQRFNADFFTGLITYIVPPLVGASIAGIELFIGSRFIKIIDTFYNHITDYVCIGFVVIIGMILLYTISVFAISFAGSIFEAIFSMLAVNAMIPLFLFISWINVVNAAHFGLTGNSFANSYPFFTTSPIGAFGFIIFYSEQSIFEGSSFYYSSSYLNTIYFNFIIRTILFTALIFFITYLLYKHRKAEDVSKPYVYNVFYYILMCVAVYCITSVLKIISHSSGFIAALITSGIIWFVMEVIRRRGFKRFGTALISFAAAIIVVNGTIKVIDVTQGLGIAKRIPSASSVTDIEINAWGNSESINEEIIMHDPQIISDAIELNKEIVDRHYNPDNYNYEFSDYVPENSYIEKEKSDKNKKKYTIDEQCIKIIYYIKNGSSVTRQFRVPSKVLTKLFCDINTSEEYAKQISSNLFNSSLVDKETGYYYNITPENAEACIFTLTDKIGKDQQLYLSVEEGRELTDAIRQDITAITPDDLDKSEYYCKINRQIVNSSFSNTIRFFEEHNINYNKTGQELVDEIDIHSETLTISPFKEYLFDLFMFNHLYSGISFKYDVIDDFTLRSEYIKLDTILSLGNYTHHSNLDIVSKHIEFTDKEAVGKLLEVATPIVINDKILAEINCDTVTLFVYDLPENRELLEKAKDAIVVYNNKTGEVYD